jgi:hypothetical protein
LATQKTETMKKSLILSSMALFVAGSILVSCKKDETAPTVTPKDGTTSTFDLGAAVDPGATANDDSDGDISASVISDFATAVKKNEVNTYTVTYKVADKAGNEGTATRTVKVKSDKLSGLYEASDVVTGAADSTFNGTFAWTSTVTQSTTEYNKLIFSNFGGFAVGTVYATVTGTNITIPSQTVGVNGGGNVTVAGTGTYDGVAFKVKTLSYSAGILGQGVTTLTKQ